MIVDGDYRPILVLPCIMGKKKVKFLCPNKVHTITGEWAKFTKKVLKYCDGCFSVVDIAENLHLDKYVIIEHISVLSNNGIVVDSRRQYQHFNRVDSFPTFFDSPLTQKEISQHQLRAMRKFGNGGGEEKQEDKNDDELWLFQVLAERESCRHFLEKNISHAQILTLCEAGYSKLSTGHVTVPSAGGLYPLSIYVIVPRDMDDIARGYYLYDPAKNELLIHEDEPDMEMIKFCFNNEDMLENSIQIVIAADVDSVAYKYGNRAYRFCLIETGHVAQNITIAATEMYLGTCEMGGLLDEPTKNELTMMENEMPLLGMVVGYPAPETETINFAKFIEENVDEDGPVRDLCVWSEPEGGFFEASVRYTVDNGRNWYFANGTANSNIMASFKAVVEAYERIAVREAAGVKNSSGVAADFSFEKASKKAMFELIERDAIMRCWKEKQAPDRFNPTSIHASLRQLSWKEEGREVSFMRLACPNAPKIPVVLVTITSDEYPYFVCGAAAGFDIDAVQNKALYEAESALFFYLRNPDEGKVPRFEDISDPEDHGRLYRMSKEAARAVDWLTKGNIVELDTRVEYSYQIEGNVRTLEKFDNGLIVVQARNPEFLEMTFGTDGENILPHFFA